MFCFAVMSTSSTEKQTIDYDSTLTIAISQIEYCIVMYCDVRSLYVDLIWMFFPEENCC